MNRSNTLAIDFGTCNSSAAVMNDGNPRLIKEPVKQGYCFPSSVYLDESGQILVGHFAESKKVKDISRYRSKIKRDLIQDRPYLLGQNGEHEFTAQQLITEILKTLKQEAEKITLALAKGMITDVVITIPATYRQNKREAMKQAALNAGFTSVQLIEEPVAAAMHYHAQNPATFQEGDIILIYDLGGGTFDATLIKKLENGFEVLGQPVGIECCGGTNFDQAIFQHLKANCSEQLQEKFSTKGNSLENFIVDFCRDIKHQFSGTAEAIGQIPFDSQLYELNRDDFNRMINSAVEQTIVCCEDLIKSAGLELPDISKVLMVGGSCRLPFIQESVENRLESSVLLIDEPELAVCQGAVIFGEIQWQEKKQTLYFDHQTEVNAKSSNADNLKENNIMRNRNLTAWDYIQIGNEYLDNREYLNSINAYKQAVKIKRNNAEALFNLGQAYFQIGDNRKATKVWNQAIKADKNYVKNQINLIKNQSRSETINMSSFQNLIEALDQLFVQITKSPTSFVENLFEKILNVHDNNIPIEPKIVDIYAYEEAMNYFRYNRPHDERIKKGSIIKQGNLITLAFLNCNNEVVVNSNSIPYGRCFEFRRLDEKLSYLLKDSEVFYIEY